MSRCTRCNACEIDTCMWAVKPCAWCGFPGEDRRSEKQIKEDDKAFKEWKKEQEHD